MHEAPAAGACGWSAAAAAQCDHQPQQPGREQCVVGRFRNRNEDADVVARVEGINRPLAERIWASLHGLDAGAASEGAK